MNPDKSYTQALSSGPNVNTFVHPRAVTNFGVTNKTKLFIVSNNQSHSNINAIAIGHKPSYAKFPSKNQSQPPGKPTFSNMNSATMKNC